MNTLLRSDISTKDDIKLLVDTFYDNVNKEPKLSAIFNDHSHVDWNEHLPKMYGFWNTLLLGTAEYKGNSYQKHAQLPVDATHFSTWLALFEHTVDSLFEGEVANDAKLRARSLAIVFQSKMGLWKSEN